MPRWVVSHISPTQNGGEPTTLDCSLVLPPVDHNPDDPWLSRSWEADNAGAAISQAALRLREGGDFFATNVDTLVVAEGVELQMQAVVPGVRAASAARRTGRGPIDHP